MTQPPQLDHPVARADCLRALGLLVLLLTVAACANDLDDDPYSPAESAPADTCFKQRNEVLQTLSQLAEARAGTCVSDDDCTLVSLSIPCQSSCQAGVLKSRANEAVEAISDYAKEVCPTLPTTCGISPQCAAPKGAACLRGTCVVNC